MKIKQKKGISLIVLVITIVVMIILAMVVILSLDSSNIIERANEAKEATNLANLKEAASVALAEYKLEVSLGNIDGSMISANDYVKNKLEEQGMDTSTMAVSKDGKVMTGLTKVAAKFVGEGVEIGATVTGYDLSSNTKTTYATTGNENTAPTGTSEAGATSQNVIRASTLTWKYMGVSKKGEALIVLETASNMPTIKLSGKGGYLNGPTELDLACDSLYSSDMGKARSIDIEDVKLVLGINPVGIYHSAVEAKEVENPQKLTIGEIISRKGETALESTETPDGKDISTYVPTDINILKSNIISNDERVNLIYQNTNYWIASIAIDVWFGDVAYFKVNYCQADFVGSHSMFRSRGDSTGNSYALRPVVELASDVNVSYNGVAVTLSK